MSEAAAAGARWVLHFGAVRIGTRVKNSLGAL